MQRTKKEENISKLASMRKQQKQRQEARSRIANFKQGKMAEAKAFRSKLAQTHRQIINSSDKQIEEYEQRLIRAEKLK